MTQFGAAPPPPKARSNVYTVLAVIATLALGAACVYVGMKNVEMTGPDQPGATAAQPGKNPFYIHKVN